MKKTDFLELEINKILNSNRYNWLNLNIWTKKVIEEDFKKLAWYNDIHINYIKHLENTLTKRNKLIKKLRKNYNLTK